MKSLREEILHETSTLHKVAEKAGFNQILLSGKANREMYGKYLLQKYHIFHTLEKNLNHNKENSIVKDFIFPELERSSSIQNDLECFIPKWQELPLLSSIASYIYRLNYLGENEPALLIAHAYTNYLAELSGGQIMKKILQKHYQLQETELHLYNFNQISNISEFRSEYHRRMEKHFGNSALRRQFIEEIKLSFIFAISFLIELMETTIKPQSIVVTTK